MTEFKRLLIDEEATIAVGRELADIVKSLNQGVVAYLYGDLGAGKTI